MIIYITRVYRDFKNYEVFLLGFLQELLFFHIDYSPTCCHGKTMLMRTNIFHYLVFMSLDKISQILFVVPTVHNDVQEPSVAILKIQNQTCPPSLLFPIFAKQVVKRIGNNGLVWGSMSLFLSGEKA